MNQVLEVCLFVYGHCIGIGLAIPVFLIAKEEHMVSLNSFLISLILLPSLLSMRLLCFFGQGLENEAEQFKEALYCCPWISKPQELLKSLRIMMLMASEPLHLRAIMFSFNNMKLLEFLNAAYTLINFLTTMNLKMN